MKMEHTTLHRKAIKAMPFRSTEISSSLEVGCLSFNPVISYLSLKFIISGKINFQQEIYNIYTEM